MRILYLEGEPRWDYKFIRRSDRTDDQTIELVTMLRTTQNKTYTQSTTGDFDTPRDRRRLSLQAGRSFEFDGLIIGSVEANYFTPAQQQMIRDFAGKRGGGVLFTAGRYSLDDGGYANTPMAEMMPLRLTNDKTFIRNFAEASLTEPAARARSAASRTAATPISRAGRRCRRSPIMQRWARPSLAR